MTSWASFSIPPCVSPFPVYQPPSPSCSRLAIAPKFVVSTDGAPWQLTPLIQSHCTYSLYGIIRHTNRFPVQPQIFCGHNKDFLKDCYQTNRPVTAVLWRVTVHCFRRSSHCVQPPHWITAATWDLHLYARSTFSTQRSLLHVMKIKR
jgi:hypothetical protein